MKNRIIAIVTLGSFLVFCWSCYSLQEIKPEVLATAKPGDYDIRKIEKTTGEIIEYSEKSPGQVEQGQIMVKGKLTYTVETVEVDSAGLEIISRPGAQFIEVKTRDGRIYGWIQKIDERGNKSVLHILKAGKNEFLYHPVPLSEIQKVWARKFDIGKILIPLLMVGIFVGIAVYVFDWREFEADFWNRFKK